MGWWGRSSGKNSFQLLYDHYFFSPRKFCLKKPLLLDLKGCLSYGCSLLSQLNSRITEITSRRYVGSSNLQHVL